MTVFSEMRRKCQQLSQEEAIHILSHATSGVLSVIDTNGYPYGVPLSHVYADGKIFFHSAISGHKIDAIRNSNKASFTVIAQDEVHPETFTTHFRSVICYGRVRIIENETEKLSALHMLGKRYNPEEAGIQHEIDKDFTHVAVIEFTIEHITGKEAIELVRERQTGK